MPLIGQHTRLHFCGDQSWELREGREVLAEYQWSQIRYSISWKAYCFGNAAEQRSWQDHSDDLSLTVVLDMLEKSLRDRGMLSGAKPDPTEFAMMLVKGFVSFPGAQALA